MIATGAIAKITRGILLLELSSAALVGLAFATLKDTPAGLAVLYGLAFVLLVRLIITANNFIVAWCYGSETPPAHRLTNAQACALFAGEFRATLWSSSWALPFKSVRQFHAAPDKMRPGSLPVLLVHGWGCNSGYWKPMSRALARANISHRAVSLEPVLADIDQYVSTIHTAVEALCSETGSQSVVIVGHSMGGLATRAYLRKYGRARVAQLVTLGSPHHGTVLANFGRGANSRQMHLHGGAPSAWLQQLNAEESAEVRARIVSVYSHHDNIIAPQTSSHLPGARNIEYRGIGHVALGLHPLIHARVIAEVRSASAPANNESRHSMQNSS